MRMPARRLLAGLFASALLLATAFPTAAAGKPTIDPVPFPEDGVLLPGGVFCAVDVFVDLIRNTEKSLTFPADEDGNVLQIITGQLWVSATNVETGESTVLNISGPYRVVTAPDGSTQIVFFGSSVPVVPPGFIVTTGRAVLDIAPDGSAELVSVNGRSIDVCPLIGAD